MEKDRYTLKRIGYFLFKNKKKRGERFLASKPKEPSLDENIEKIKSSISSSKEI